MTVTLLPEKAPGLSPVTPTIPRLHGCLPLDAATDYEALSMQRNASRWVKKLIKFGFLPDPA